MALRGKKVVTLTKKSLNGTELGVWLHINFIGMGCFLQRVCIVRYLKCVIVWTFLHLCNIDHKEKGSTFIFALQRTHQLDRLIYFSLVSPFI